MEKHLGAKSDRIALRLGGRVDFYCEQTNAGLAFGSQTGFRCFADRPKLVRTPDVSFVARGRLPNDEVPDGDIPLRPDLAVEVVSPNDTYEGVEVKVMEYLGTGVRLIWMVSPTAKTVLVRRPDKTCTPLDITDTRGGEDVLPGFTCPVAELIV